MKLVITERSKHRLIGALVILSIAVIFLPAVMQKSNQRFEENINVSLKLPTRPVMPRVAIPNQRVMFKAAKVAHVDIPAAPAVRTASLIAKAEPLVSKAAQHPAVIASTPRLVAANKSSVVSIAQSIQTAQHHQSLGSGQAKTLTTPMFAIQVATFVQKSNANLLVGRLRDKGFVASYNTIKGKQGDVYQVVVGKLNQRHDAVNLQKRLADNMQLNGFIIQTRVS